MRPPGVMKTIRMQTSAPYKESRWPIHKVALLQSTGWAGWLMISLMNLREAEWNCGVELRSGIAEWNCGVELRSGIAEWNCGVELRHGIAEWNCGVELRSGIAEWNCGVELRSGIAEWNCGVELRRGLDVAPSHA